METNLITLQKEATKIAQEHGWRVFWDRALCKNKGELTVGEALNLISGEASGEATEEFRNDNIEKFAEECADIVIRVLHLCGELDINLTEEINKKMDKNRKRQLHHGRKNY